MWGKQSSVDIKSTKTFAHWTPVLSSLAPGRPQSAPESLLAALHRRHPTENEDQNKLLKLNISEPEVRPLAALHQRPALLAPLAALQHPELDGWKKRYFRNDTLLFEHYLLSQLSWGDHLEPSEDGFEVCSRKHLTMAPNYDRISQQMQDLVMVKSKDRNSVQIRSARAWTAGNFHPRIISWTFLTPHFRWHPHCSRKC